MNGDSTKNGKDAAEVEAWQHFCSVLELSKAAVEALVEKAGFPPEKWYAYAKYFMGRGKQNDLFDFDSSSQIGPISRTYLEERLALAHEHRRSRIVPISYRSLRRL